MRATLGVKKGVKTKIPSTSACRRDFGGLKRRVALALFNLV